MKKTFLKSIVAAAVVGAAVALSSVAAFAADEVNWLATDSSIPAELGFTFSDTSKTITFTEKRTGCFVDPIFGENGKTAGKTGIDTYSQSDETLFTSDSSGNITSPITKSFAVSPSTTGTIKLYICGDGSAKTNCFKIYGTTYDEAQGKYKRNSNPIVTANRQSGRDDTAIVSVNFSVTAGERYTVYSNNSDSVLLGATFVPSIASTATQIGATDDYYAADTINGTTYIVHSVTETEMAYDSLSLLGLNGTAVAPTTQVYTSVEFSDSSVLKASDIGAAAIYAVKVKDTEGAAPTATFTWVNE